MPSFYGSISVTAIVDTSILDAMAANAPQKTDAILVDTCSKIEADAKQMAPVDTGALRNSIEFEKEGFLTYIVHDGVEYGVFQELGTRFMPAHPFFIPAVERNADILASRLPEVLK